MNKLKHILVTGGAGYVGSTLVNRLTSNNYQVSALDSMVFGNDRISDLFQSNAVQFIQGDIRDNKILEKSLEGIDCVVHLAAITGPLCDRIPEATKQINEVATLNLLNLCKKKQVKRFIFASTCSNYGSNLDVVDESTPLMSLSLYSETKVKMESAILNSKDSNFDPCVLRFATVFGLSPKMRFDLLVQELILDAILNKKIKIFGPQYWRPLVHVNDVATACILGIESPSDLISGEVYNVGSNEQNYRKLELAELVKEQIPDTEIEIQESKKDPRNYRVSFDKISQKLHFKAEKTVRDGIAEIVNSIRKDLFDPSASSSSIRTNQVEKVSVY